MMKYVLKVPISRLSNIKIRYIVEKSRKRPISATAKESLYTIPVGCMKAAGKTTREMEKASNCMPMATLILANTRTVKQTAKGSISGKMAKYMMVNLKLASSREMDCGKGSKVILMLGIGWIIRLMAMGFMFG